MTKSCIPAMLCARQSFRRNRLVSMMLQDRGVARLICAPHGFGKSLLACEYATRLFSGKDVRWVDAASPDFLFALDAGAFPAPGEGEACLPDLLVLDDVPWLHEQRAAALAQQLDSMLYQGVEVVVTSLPSADFLQSLQPDRILITGSDLLLTERECLETRDDGSLAGKAGALEMWKRAGAEFMGRVPAVAWASSPDEARVSCLASFFAERLPFAAVSAALGMLFLSHGKASDLERLGLEVRADDCRMLAEQYPFLGLGVGGLDFDAPALPFDLLRRALAGSELSSWVFEGALPFVERVFAILFERGDVDRAEELASVFCLDRRCSRWLVAWGWDLLDQGKVELVEELFMRCELSDTQHRLELAALYSWMCGLQGDALEAEHFARKVLDAVPLEREEAGRARLLAYLSLAAFAAESMDMYASWKDGPAADVLAPDDFLAAVAGACTKEELARALGPDSCELRQTAGQAQEDIPADRADAFSVLFTGCHERFWTSCAYRVALHVLMQLNSAGLRRLGQQLGCDIVVRLRRDGVRRYTEAVLVRDLWSSGYFGLGLSSSGKRDAHLLSQAAELLCDLSARRGGGPARIPWGQDEPQACPGSGQAVALKGSAGGQRVRIKLFGHMEIVADGHKVPESDLRRKARQVLILLLLGGGRDISRAELLEQVWPGKDRATALDNFYTVWSNLTTKVAGKPCIERCGEFCRVDPRHVSADVFEFEKAMRCLLTGGNDSRALLDTYARIEALYRGDLVPGEQGVAAIDAQRRRFKGMFVDGMVAASAQALEASDVRLALWFARKAMENGDAREDVYFAQIRAQMAAGQRCSAIRTYFECRRYLRDELGLDPSEGTQALYDKLISVDPSLTQLSADTFGV